MKKNIEFLFYSKKLDWLNGITLTTNCENLDNNLKHEKLNNLDGQEFFQELKDVAVYLIKTKKKYNFLYQLLDEIKYFS